MSDAFNFTLLLVHTRMFQTFLALWVCLGLEVSTPSFMTKKVTIAQEKNKERKWNDTDGEWVPQKGAQRKSQHLVCFISKSKQNPAVIIVKALDCY